MTSLESIITTNVMSNATISAAPRSSCTFMRSISLLLDRRVVAHAHRVSVRGISARERLGELERRSRVIVVVLVHPPGHVEGPPTLQGVRVQCEGVNAELLVDDARGGYPPLRP